MASSRRLFALRARCASSLAAAIDLFSYSDFLIFFNKDQYCVDGAETNRIFYHLREDLEKTSLAAYMGELAETLVPQGEPAQEYLSLMLNCLHLLETDQRTVDFIKPLFELRLLTMAGYMPDLVGCTWLRAVSGGAVLLFTLYWQAALCKLL